MKWYSSIKPDLMKHFLFRGSVQGMFGIILILASSNFLYQSLYSFAGFSLFALGIGLITYGLIPYKKLSRMELFPNSLQLQHNSILYRESQKPLLSIPLALIEQIHFLEGSTTYGIAITLSQNASEKVAILQKDFNIKKFLEKSPAKGALFLPYFSQKCFLELKEELLFTQNEPEFI